MQEKKIVIKKLTAEEQRLFNEKINNVKNETDLIAAFSTISNNGKAIVSFIKKTANLTTQLKAEMVSKKIDETMLQKVFVSISEDRKMAIKKLKFPSCDYCSSTALYAYQSAESSFNFGMAACSATTTLGFVGAMGSGPAGPVVTLGTGLYSLWCITSVYMNYDNAMETAFAQLNSCFAACIQ